MDIGVIFAAISSIIPIPCGFAYVIILTDEWRFSVNIVKRYIFIVCLFMLGTDLFFLIWQGIGIEGKAWISLFNLLLCFIVYLFLSKQLDQRTLYILVSACMVSFAGNAVLGFVKESTEYMHFIIKICTFILNAVLLYRYFRKPFLAAFRSMKSGWIRFTLVPFSIVVVFCIMIELEREPQNIIGLRYLTFATCLIAFSVYVAFYYTFCSLEEQFKLQEEYDILQTEISTLKKYSKAVSSMNEGIDICRHDIRHYIQVQAALLNKNNVIEAKKALEGMKEDFTKNKKRLWLNKYTGYSLVDAILSFYGKVAEIAQIEMLVKLSIPVQLGELLEFSAALSDILENAVEDCKKIPKGKERIIKITGGQMKSQYFMEIVSTINENDFPGCQRNAIIDGEYHRYGTQSIAAFSKKYGAILEYIKDAGYIKIRIIVKIPVTN